MNSPNTAASPERSIDASDIYYALFRHKWIILLCAVAGVVTAAAVYQFAPVPYLSEAKLFIRFVITEGKSLGPNSSESVSKSPDQRGETIMNSETEILTSLDLAKQVAEAIGPEKILAKIDGSNDINKAANVIRRDLTVKTAPFSSVIQITFHNPDVTVSQLVLRQLIAQYLKVHVETHRSVGVIGDILIQETDQLRSRLAQTEVDLRKVRNQAGVTSLEETKKNSSENLNNLRKQIFATQAELAERMAIAQEMRKSMPQSEAESAESAPPSAPPTLDQVAAYQSAVNRVFNLKRAEQELLGQFTGENDRVKAVRVQLAEAEAARQQLQAEHPLLGQAAANARVVSQVGTLVPEKSLATVTAEAVALQAKIKVLMAQQDELRAEVAKVDELEGTLVELGRKKELDEANYRYFAARLEQSRINEALGGGRVSNITEIQSPSPPLADRGRTQKLAMGLALGGIALGLAWAFSIELYFDRTIRRPLDVERELKLPLFLTIPDVGQTRRWSSRNKIALPDSNLLASVNQNGAELALSQNAESMHVFHETLRDRLISYFESRNLTHKPKLVAVTSLEQDAGVTTIAAGLARSLSETGEGNVLLVDMTAAQGSSMHFVQGRATCGLDDILVARQNAHVHENLYVVAGGDNSEQLTRNMPQRFSKLVPKLKASDFDYIIFDMPAVTQISITPRLASFMDMVLMVVESEKTDRDVVKRSSELLARSRAPVGVILNKTRSYGPGKQSHEFLGV